MHPHLTYSPPHVPTRDADVHLMDIAKRAIADITLKTREKKLIWRSVTGLQNLISNKNIINPYSANVENMVSS